MAGGEKDRKNDFQQNPFKRLKGFSVSPQGKAQPVSVPGAPLSESTPDETDLFATEMARLGVTHGTTGDAELEAPDSRSEDVVPKDVSEPTPSDQEVFLSSLGAMESVFVDELPESGELAAAPRRMRQVRRGELVPEAQLDLHGLSHADARERVRHFLDNSTYHGRKTVLIVTGRGKGSDGEPVLRAEIERYLRHEATAWVAEWGRAPARYGGEGALVVFLKGRKKKI